MNDKALTEYDSNRYTVVCTTASLTKKVTVQLGTLMKYESSPAESTSFLWPQIHTRTLRTIEHASWRKSVSEIH